MQVQGYFDLRFEAVKDAFAALFEQSQERGAALCIQVGGETVVDLWAGYMDRDSQQPWHSDTLVNLFSCTKPLAAVVMLQLVAEGKLELDAPVAQYWPEFDSPDKSSITVRHLLSHRAGLPAVRAALPAEALYQWDTMAQAMANEPTWWTPDETHGYAPITYGWLVGEVIRRVDGRSPGRSIAARISEPLGLDLHVGLDEREFDRVAYVARGKGNIGDEAAQRLLKAMMDDPKGLSTRAFTNPPSIMLSTNKPEWRRMEQPAANGHGNARSLAGFYTGILNGQLLEPELLAEMCREHSVGEDRTLLTSTRYGLGCMLDQPTLANATYGMGSGAFGHPGAGGCCGFALPQHEVAFGFVTNTLGPYVLMDPRAQRMARALADCL